MSGIDLREGDPAYEARAAGCTCAWLRGFGVGRPIEEWTEKIIDYDENCSIHALSYDRMNS